MLTQRVGCDLKIGSTQHVDECGVCGGNGSSCARPMYKWQDAESSACSTTCGGGWLPIYTYIVCERTYLYLAHTFACMLLYIFTGGRADVSIILSGDLSLHSLLRVQKYLCVAICRVQVDAAGVRQ